MVLGRAVLHASYDVVRRGENPPRCVQGVACACVTGPSALTEASEAAAAAAANLIGPILLVIACRSQSRLVREINTVLDVEFMRL